MSPLLVLFCCYSCLPIMESALEESGPCLSGEGRRGKAGGCSSHDNKPDQSWTSPAR